MKTSLAYRMAYRLYRAKSLSEPGLVYLSIVPLRTNFGKIFIDIHIFWFRECLSKCHLQMSAILHQRWCIKCCYSCIVFSASLFRSLISGPIPHQQRRHSNTPWAKHANQHRNVLKILYLHRDRDNSLNTISTWQLTQCGLVAHCGVVDMSQHWLR